MPYRGESERCCCRRASNRTLGPELAVLLPREDALVAQSRGDCCMRNPSNWIRAHPETSLIVLLRRPSSHCCAGFAGTPRCALREHHSVWRGGKKPPNSLNSRIFYALSILSCGSSVSTARSGRSDCNSSSAKRSCTSTRNLAGPDRAEPALCGGLCRVRKKIFRSRVVAPRSRCRHLMRTCARDAGSLTASSEDRQFWWG